jgi:(p)ppGpp synthase/HD superfamily hydrolase
VEDTDTTLEEIEEAFGSGVHDLVEAMTEDKEVEPYERRKEHHRDQVEAGGERAVLIYAADKVANLRDLRTLYANVGEGAASRFKAPLDVRVHLWEGDAEMIDRVHPGHELGAQLRSELAAFKADRQSTA